ncbi:hypothetical protein [Nocardia sp. NPDC057440]|uniref:hypothetical protein n=1 Tax=Nocardia sp. NPDC057440 TaxID=3346134 RepID=UPI003670D5E9
MPATIPHLFERVRKTMSLLSRESILTADDRNHEDVEVPEWGGTVRVRAMSGFERDKFETGMIERRGGKQVENFTNLRARLVALVLIDEDGKRLFSDKDVHQLGTKSAAALDRVYTTAQKLNGISNADVEELTEVFDETPDENSISD